VPIEHVSIYPAISMLGAMFSASLRSRRFSSKFPIKALSPPYHLLRGGLSKPAGSSSSALLFRPLSDSIILSYLLRVHVLSVPHSLNSAFPTPASIAPAFAARSVLYVPMGILRVGSGRYGPSAILGFYYIEITWRV
jgi:hypothetical protein